MKIHIKKGDTVYVLSGNDKGKSAKVLTVFPAKYSAIVSSLVPSGNFTITPLGASRLIAIIKVCTPLRSEISSVLLLGLLESFQTLSF